MFECRFESHALTRGVMCAMTLYAMVLGAGAGRPCWSCTTAVISGSATADGRPLLWKNRDITTAKNEVVLITGGRYKVLAVVNAGARSSIWMGVNEAGLCIENSVTRDLAGPKDSKGPGNGSFMLLALKTCATVEDVKQLLEKTDQTGRTTNANFGVIDAEGGAALFESGHRSHVMFDANDPQVAPQGIVVRSNFSMTGQSFETLPTREQLTEIYSGERYLRATELIASAVGKELDLPYVLRHCARDLADGDCTPYPGSVNGPTGSLPEFIHTKNTISRSTTVSFAVFQGVKKGENPLLTTMWVGLGDPKFSVAIPCWVAAGVVAEELQGKDGGALGQAAISLKEAYYSKDQEGIRTENLQEIWAELWSFEDQLLKRTNAQLDVWRKRGVNSQAMSVQHLSAAEQALANLSRQLKRTTPLTGKLSQ